MPVSHILFTNCELQCLRIVEIGGAVQSIGIFQHADLRLEAVGTGKNGMTLLFQSNIIILGHSVETDDEMTFIQQALGEMKPDETCRSGNQISHRVTLPAIAYCGRPIPAYVNPFERISSLR